MVQEPTSSAPDGYVAKPLTTALAAGARVRGGDVAGLVRLRRSASIDAVIAFLTVAKERGFETRMVI